MTIDSILHNVSDYYTNKLKEHGATSRGVDWNSVESHELRFKQLLKICDANQPFSLNDYGCGFGALVNYLDKYYSTFDYRGFDIAPAMITEARQLFGQRSDCQFYDEISQLKQADYTLASGIFNVRLQTSETDWLAYMHRVVDQMAELSLCGFAFNVLTLYSDVERRRPDLYYADPLYWFDFCKKKYSNFVALLHDYPLYEFTLLVRK